MHQINERTFHELFNYSILLYFTDGYIRRLAYAYRCPV